MIVTLVLYLLLVTPVTRTQGFFNPDSHDSKQNNLSEGNESEKERKFPELSGKEDEEVAARPDRLEGEFIDFFILLLNLRSNESHKFGFTR